MSEEPEQEALFYIEGPDERGCVWMHGTSSRDPWAQNLGLPTRSPRCCRSGSARSITSNATRSRTTSANSSQRMRSARPSGFGSSLGRVVIVKREDRGGPMGTPQAIKTRAKGAQRLQGEPQNREAARQKDHANVQEMIERSIKDHGA